jgi:hypothetical protein
MDGWSVGRGLGSSKNIDPPSAQRGEVGHHIEGKHSLQLPELEKAGQGGDPHAWSVRFGQQSKPRFIAQATSTAHTTLRRRAAMEESLPGDRPGRNMMEAPLTATSKKARTRGSKVVREPSVEDKHEE